MIELELIDRAKSFGDATALVIGERSYSYAELVDASARVASSLLSAMADKTPCTDLAEARVAFLVPTGFEYVATQWGIWRAGGIALPLSIGATEPEIEYALRDSQASLVVTTARTRAKIDPIANRLKLLCLNTEEASVAEVLALPAITSGRGAMILYTSGTTSKPKGVLSTHVTVEAQISTLVEAWGWQPDDRIPLFLPLHHIHGIINVLCCALWSGAAVNAFEKFDVDQILTDVAENRYTVFMAVPTIYVKLIDAIESADPSLAATWTDGFAAMRLMISGSAALPATMHTKWTELTGQKLLERYGMTEIGMALSNPLVGERRPGAVGVPLPGVTIRLVTESGEEITSEDEPGEIQMRGPCLFKAYWNKPEVTAASFQDGWFRTGDMAVREQGYYRILGRLSVDIIKSGGYKLSALEIENELRCHPAIKECAVVGLADEKWGEIVAAAVVLETGEELLLDTLQAWASNRLSQYKLPRRLQLVNELPRNAMGKVMKPAVSTLFEE